MQKNERESGICAPTMKAPSTILSRPLTRPSDKDHDDQDAVLGRFGPLWAKGLCGQTRPSKAVYHGALVVFPTRRLRRGTGQGRGIKAV